MTGMRVLFFGRLRDVMGTSEILLPATSEIGSDIELVAWLSGGDASKSDTLSCESIRLCVDQTIVPRGAELKGASEIAFLPPFSGG